MEPSIIVESAYGINLEFVLSLLGILLGLSAVIIFLEKRDTTVKEIKEGVTLIMFGISSAVLATVWDLFFMYMRSAPEYLEDIHPLFMAIGMGFFIAAALKFSSRETYSSAN